MIRAIETIALLSDAVAENEASIVAIETRLEKVEIVLRDLVKMVDELKRG